MAALVRFALSASLSLVSASILWGCSSSSNNGLDAAATITKMDGALGTSSDLPVLTAYDSSLLVDGHVNIDGSSTVDGSPIAADAFLPIDVAGKDVESTSFDLLSGPDKPASSDLPSDKDVDSATPADGPIVISLDAPTSSDLGNGSVDTASGPDVSTCGALSQACCANDGGQTCNSNLLCLGGASCSCAKTLFGRYLLREDGALLYETDSTSTAQAAVLDAGTGLPLAGVTLAAEDIEHGCAVIGSSSSAWCWRTAATGNAAGQLANGTTDNSGPLFRATQVLIAANQPLSNVASLATTEPSNYMTGTSCAVTTAGALYCWGDLTWLVNNGGATLTAAYATQITTDGVTPLSGVIQAATNGRYGCVVTKGATSNGLSCWGNNSTGQLGTGDTKSQRYPTSVVGLTNPSKVVVQGYNGGTTCAIDGSNVKCWGYNAQGQSGTGATSSPVLAPTLVTLMGGATALGDVVDISVGESANYPGLSCVLTTASTVLCWGSTGYQAYPTIYGISNVIGLGTIDGYVNGPKIRLLTSDGLYHIDNTARSPNCGLLQ